MRQLARWSALALLILFSRCLFNSTEELTPETVVRKWQRYIDYNQFDSARLYSLGQARSYVDFVDELTTSDTMAVLETQLLDLRCETVGDSAVCFYSVPVEGANMPGKVWLRRVKNRWQVSQVENFDAAPGDTLEAGQENLLFPADSVDEELE